MKKLAVFLGVFAIVLSTAILPANIAKAQGPYWVTISPSSVEVEPGSTAVYTGTVNRTTRNIAGVDLRLIGAPHGSMVSFDPPGVAMGGPNYFTYTLEINVPDKVVPKTYDIVVEATWYILFDDGKKYIWAKETASAQLVVLPDNQHPYGWDSGEKEGWDEAIPPGLDDAPNGANQGKKTGWVSE